LRANAKTLMRYATEHCSFRLGSDTTSMKYKSGGSNSSNR
jgi:hypothetical protein